MLTLPQITLTVMKFLRYALVLGLHHAWASTISSSNSEVAMGQDLCPEEMTIDLLYKVVFCKVYPYYMNIE